jgi:hypothetical protein
MRVWIALVMLTVATPVCAQTTMGTTSGASAMVDINSPANTTAHVITTRTVTAPGLAAAGIETCLGSASGGLSLWVATSAQRKSMKAVRFVCCPGSFLRPEPAPTATAMRPMR